MDGHPTGSSFNIIPDGLKEKAQAVENSLESWDDDITTNYVNDARCGIGGTGPSTVPGDRDKFGRATSFTDEDENTECLRCKPASECVHSFLDPGGFYYARSRQVFARNAWVRESTLTYEPVQDSCGSIEC